MFDTSFPVPEAIEWTAIAPIVAVILTGVLALIMEIVAPKRANRFIQMVSLIGLVIAAYFTLPLYNQRYDALVGMVQVDQFGTVAQLLLILCCFLTLLFSEGYLASKKIAFGEFYPLVLWSTAGGMLMCSSGNLLVLFIGLEMLSIALYVLAGLSRRETKSEESALKYFLLGSFATGFLLYGIALFYGATGSLQLSTLEQTARSGQPATGLLTVALGMLFVGLGFKAAFVPFHQWTPDVYQGAPTNVTAFMAAASKTAAIAMLLRVLEAGSSMFEVWAPPLQVVAILTMVVGNAVALLQTDVKRILAYSSIAHAGYLLVGLLAYARYPDRISTMSIAYYLLAYALMTIGAFAVISMASKDGKESTRLSDMNGLWKRSPFAAIMLLLFMVSFIGIPPFAGFWGKLGLFRDAMSADLPHLAIVLGATSILSVAYYLQIARAVFVSEEESKHEYSKPTFGVSLATTICAFGLVVVALFYEPVSTFLKGQNSSQYVSLEPRQ